MNDSKIIIEEVNDPAEVARVRAAHEQFKRSGDWRQAHWPDLLPQARDRFPAVAGPEAHITDTLDAAWAWVQATHPDDHGAILQYLPKEEGQRLRGHRGRTAGV